MAKRIEFSKEERAEICQLFQNGLNRTSIAKKFNHTVRVINRILEEEGIDFEIKKFSKERTMTQRKYKINDNYFSISNQTSDSCYILGLLASDGCVASKQNQVYIELQRCDRELLEKINVKISNERPIKDYINHSKNYENSKLYFFSSQIKEDLSQYNIVPNKTHQNEDFLENVQEQYIFDFIRGFFDGDGSIKWTNGSITWQIDSSSLKTLEHIQSFLEQYNIFTKVVEHTEETPTRNRNIPLYRIYCYNKENCSKLYSFLYKENTETLYLERKYQHFSELLLKYKTHETLNLNR